MPIANYSTEVSATKSVAEIQTMLSAHKAKSIMINYENGEPVSLAFLVATKHGDIPFALPANVKKVEALLLKGRAKPPEKWHYNYDSAMSKIHEQAGRVAWRILKDWVRAQMAIIETEMVTLEQVFLPYMKSDTGQTLYEIMESKKFLMLGAGQSEVKNE